MVVGGNRMKWRCRLCGWKEGTGMGPHEWDDVHFFYDDYLLRPQYKNHEHMGFYIEKLYIIERDI